MNVKEAIRELKKYPKDYRVAFASHDNHADEIQGVASYAMLLEEGETKECYGECVVFRC